MKKDDQFIKELIEYYGEKNLPNPEQYPKRFEFMVKAFEFYKTYEESVSNENRK